jgi:uncharacterized protein (TIRG00374 family)
LLRQKRFWFGLTISVAFLAIFLARTDFGQIRGSYSGANYALAFAAVPLYFVGFWLRTVRWRYLLKPVSDIRTGRLYPVVLIGLMTNNVAPARVGELVRAYLLGERERMSKSTALGTIAVDRAFDGLTLVTILGIVIAFSGANSEVKSIGAGTALVFGAASAVLAGLALSPRRGRALLVRLIRFLPEALADKAEGLLDAFVTGLLAIRNPWVLVKAGVASFASWLTEATMYYLVGQAFHLGVDFSVYLVILGAANLALSVFASPGGVGPFEVVTREVLVFFNVKSSAAASAYALALHALLLGPVIIIGFVLLWSSHMSLSQMLGAPKGGAPPVPEAQGLE